MHSIGKPFLFLERDFAEILPKTLALSAFSEVLSRETGLHGPVITLDSGWHPCYPKIPKE